MKYLLLLMTICLCYIANGQTSTAKYRLADQYNYWELAAGKHAFVFVENAYIREEPDLDSKILDSLSLGTEVVIQSPGYNSTKVKGFEAPWHKVSYSIGNEQKSGFIWIGLLALGRHVDGKGNQYLHGFDRYVTVQEDESLNHYLCDVKLLDPTDLLLAEHTFKARISDQNFTYSKLLPDMGLTGIDNIYRIVFSGEACGIPTDYYYIGCNGHEFIDLPMRYTVSDAGIYYYEEKMLFPSEHQIEPDMIYIDSEEGEVIDENASEYSYKTNKKRRKYKWDGKAYTQVQGDMSSKG